MSDQGKVNYEGYRAAGMVPMPKWDELSYQAKLAWDAGATSVELWLAERPVDEDAPGNESQPEVRYALVEQMGHRATTAAVREITFCGEPMLEVTDLRTGSVHVVSPKSLYEVSWLTEEVA